MAKKLLIVHGYSDGSTSFSALGDFFIAQNVYKSKDVFYLDYSSMDDDATFRDFADKLDADHRDRLGKERIDVVCHSTGSLVVRAWLALHAERTRRRELEEPCPVDRLLCFAPANFGSDLATLGQSFLGKFRTTFFNSHSHSEDFMESGKGVLQGLEPASPFQWDLSANYDLHGAYSYFSAKSNQANKRCYPFVLAAGEGYSGIQARLIKQRNRVGTDGTVRIAGTSLNTRYCSLDFRESGEHLIWWPETKFAQIPFSVFAGVNHGSIINPDQPEFLASDGPGTLALKALKTVKGPQSYKKMVDYFDAACESNYARLPEERRDRFQQFFFRVRDDVDQLVDDYYIDFYVEDSGGKVHEELTMQFDQHFETQVYRHSVAASHRVFLMNCRKLREFDANLRAEKAKLMLEITGVSPLPDVHYEVSSFVAYDPMKKLNAGEPVLLFPNTTTLIDVILNRRQTDKLLLIKDRSLTPVKANRRQTSHAVAGRAALVRDAGK